MGIGAFKMSKTPDIVIMAEVADEVRHQRLILQYVRCGGDGLDFHALRWETQAAHEWTTIAAITKAAFQAGSSRSRWIRDIQWESATHFLTRGA